MRTKKSKTALLVKTRIKVLPVVATVILIAAASAVMSYSLYLMAVGIDEISSSMVKNNQLAVSTAGKKSSDLGLPFDYPRQTISLRGKIVVDVYFLESNADSSNTENWTDNEIKEKEDTIRAAAAWLQSAANAAQPSANVSFDINFATAETKYEPINEFIHCPRSRDDELKTLIDVINKLGFNNPEISSDAGFPLLYKQLNIRKYQRLAETNADDFYFAFLIDTSDYMSRIDEICTGNPDPLCLKGCSSFASNGGSYLILFGNIINPGVPDIFAHESAHLFHALDQYQFSDEISCSCDDTYNDCKNDDCAACSDAAREVSRTTLMGTNKRHFLGKPTSCHLGLICPADAHEGDSPFTAQIFNSGETNIGSHICPDRDEDWYKIITDNPGEIKINLISPPDKDYNISLYDQSGALKAESAKGLVETDTITFNGPAGTYFFKVWGQLLPNTNASTVTYWGKILPYAVSYNFEKTAGLPCASCYVPTSCSQ